MLKSRPKPKTTIEAFTHLSDFMNQENKQYMKYKRNGMYCGKILELPNCRAQGKDLDELDYKMHQVFRSYTNFVCNTLIEEINVIHDTFSQENTAPKLGSY